MFSFGRSKRVANIVVDNYVVRIVENNGKDLSSITTLAEKMIPQGTIQNGRIVDELAFYELMKDIVQELKLKNKQARFYVPKEIVIMRDVELPADVKENEVKQYITMEIGHTIHFPFKHPIFDVYDVPQENKESNKVTIVAAPEDELMKYTQIFSDVHLKPTAVGVHPIGVYRYFLHQQKELQKDKVYFLLELNLVSANISIFQDHLLEFLRFQSMNITREDWDASNERPLRYTFTGNQVQLDGEIEDLLNEMERLMNFYRFSMHQGDKAITDIILLGDFPFLKEVGEKLERFNLPVTIMDVEQSFEQEGMSRSFIPALGLALKGGK